jgi:hypothetical protein
MGVREKIMSFGTTAQDKYHALQQYAADMAEARERELQATNEVLDSECRLLEKEKGALEEWLKKAEAEKLVLVRQFDFAVKQRAALIAEREKWQADFNLVYKLLENDLIELNNKHKVLIAELQESTCRKEEKDDYAVIPANVIEAIINKYED